MTSWENTYVRSMIYLSLFGTGSCADKRVTLPGREEPLNMDELVVHYLRRGQKYFERKHREYPILETLWFENFMKHEQPFPAICKYLYEKDKAVGSRSVFLDKLLQAARDYSVYDTRQLMSTEEKVLRDYFGVLISIIGNILRVTPKAACVGEDSAADISAVMQYLQLRTDQDAYLALAKEFLELGGRADWDRSVLHEYPPAVLEDRTDLRLFQLEYCSAMGSQTVREWMSHLAGEQWEHDLAYYLMHWLRRHENSEISELIRRYITQYYKRNITEMELYLEPFTYREDALNRRGLQIEVMIYFAAHFSLEIPKDETGELLFLCKYPPEAGCQWLPARYMTETELRARILKNLKSGIVNETVLSWHLLYCMDHPDEAYTEAIARVARNQLRKKWVRQIAMQYTCQKMDVDMVCERILPKMKGDMFFFVAEQYRRKGNDQLANMVWHYGEKYATNKLHCDVILIQLQSRKGIRSFLEHIEKRHVFPVECRDYRAAEAIRGIDAPDLLDELERFLCLGLKDSFKDDPEDSMLDAAADALVRMAVSHPAERDTVRGIFDRCLEKYGNIDWKRDKLNSLIMKIS